MFICDKNYSCCNYQYCDTIDNLDDDAKYCCHLVEVEPVKYGKWVWFQTDKYDMAYGGTMYIPCFKCSECGLSYDSYARFDEPMEDDADAPQRCHNCGAKMSHEVIIWKD